MTIQDENELAAQYGGRSYGIQKPLPPKVQARMEDDARLERLIFRLAAVDRPEPAKKRPITGLQSRCRNCHRVVKKGDTHCTVCK